MEGFFQFQPTDEQRCQEKEEPVPHKSHQAGAGAQEVR